MPHWMALLPGKSRPLQAGDDEAEAALRDDGVSAADSALSAEHLAWWSLQFTPRVALLEEAVVLEIQASERLFGGARVLRRRIAREAAALGVQAWAHADTALAALALARHVSQDVAAEGEAENATKGAAKHKTGSVMPSSKKSAPVTQIKLEDLPLHLLPVVSEHEPTLARLGCRTLGQVRQLPRGGLSRRFGAGLLRALDQAFGSSPESFDWLTLPPTFDARLELPGRVESAPAMLFAAQRLLQQLCAWLAGRQAGITAFTLRWLHDWHRRDSSREGQWTIRMASPTRDIHRLSRLLAEHLQRIELSAPVGDISLHAEEIEALPLDSLPLFQEHGNDCLSAEPDALLTPTAQRAQRDALLALLDRLSVRLGADRVLQARIQADHRLEFTQTWQPAIEALQHSSSLRAPADKPRALQGSHAALMPVALTHVAQSPQPSWVLPEPLHLALVSDGAGVREHPVYQGRLTLLAGPHRIEAGWWDTSPGGALVTRDYYLASSEKAGLLWIFRTRHAPDDQRSPWFLHGFFA